MESYRQRRRVSVGRRRQAGITVIGFVILACLFGIVGLAALKLVPMYLQNMRLDTVLKDIKMELDGTGTTPPVIQRALAKRFDIEGITLPLDEVKITQGKTGYEVRIQYENRAPYVANVWLMVAFDKQVEIKR